MRLLSPPSLQWIAGADVIVGFAFGILAIVSFPRWIAMFDAFMAGAAFVAALHSLRLVRTNRMVEGMNGAIEKLIQVNAELINQLANRDDGSPPLSPGGSQ